VACVGVSVKRKLKVETVRCEGWALYQYPDEVTPIGFTPPAYRLTCPSGATSRTVSADKLTDALDRLFEECA